MASGRRDAGAIRSLVNAMGLQLEYTRLLNESLLLPVLIYGSETIIWKEEERPGISVVQMDSLRGLLSIGKMDKVPKARIREL